MRSHGRPRLLRDSADCGKRRRRSLPYARCQAPSATAYGCWINAAGAAAAGDHRRALEFLDRGASALVGKGLVALEVHVLAARSFVLLRVGELDQARVAADAETALAGRLDDPGLLAMAARDRVLVALADGDFPLSAGLLAEGLAEGAPVSRPLTRLARAEALARGGELGQAESELRATVLEPVRVSDFPETLVPPLSDLRFEWRLEPLNGGDGTPITVDVDIPAAEAARLDGQQDTIRASLSNLVELADRS